jgi:hypothetical protein
MKWGISDKCEIAVGDGRLAQFGLGSLRIDMDPLVVLGRVGKQVDAALRHLEP